MPKTKKDIADQILSQIKTNQVKIKSKKQILFEEFVFTLLVILFLLLSIFSFNIIFFSFHQASLPLIPLAGATLFFTLTILLIKHYDFSYKTPFSLLFGFFALIILLTAAFLSLSQLNRRLSRFSIFKPLYHSPAMHFRHHRMRHYLYMK